MTKPAVPPGTVLNESSPMPCAVRDLSDDALLGAFRATGDQAAFAEIASRHGEMVFRACFRRLGNVHDAEDAAQAVFLQLSRTPGRAQGSLGGWLHKVAGDTALTLLRARARRARHEEKAAMQKPAAQSPNEETLREELDRGIARLPTRLREAVILCFLEGHKQEDAARILGCNQGTLSRWASDGLEQLRSLLARRGAVVTSAMLIGFFAQQKATAAIPAGLLGGLGVGGAGQAAAVLADAVGKAALLAKVKIAAAVVLAAAVAGTGAVVVLRKAEPREAMMLAAFDGDAPPLNRAGEGYPKHCYEPRNANQEGLFSTSIEPADAVAGHSLRMQLTVGRLKAHFVPEDARGRKAFARDYSADPAKWRFNTYNRMRFWIKLPRSSPPHSLAGGSNMNLAAYVKRVRDADERSLDAGGGCFNHRFNVPAVEEWAQVIFNMHPNFSKDENADPGILAHPTGEPSYNYFDAWTQFSFEARGNPSRYPADYLVDEMEFYREPKPENDAQVFSIAAMHVSVENRIFAAWNRRLGEDRIAHEVRYAFEDIHRIGWDRATPAPDGIIRPLGKGPMIGMIYDSRVLPLSGRSLVYLAIKPQNANSFSQIAIPLNLKR